VKVKNNFKYLLILSLSCFSVLVLFTISFKQDSVIANSAIAEVSEKNNAVIDEAAKNNLLNNVVELKKINQDLKSSIKLELIKQLDTAIKDNTSTNHLTFARAIEKVELLEKVIKKIEKNDLKNIETQLNSLATTVQQIKKTISTFAPQSIDSKTKNNVSNFLDDQIKILEEQVGDLEASINNLETKESSLEKELLPQAINPNIRQLESEIDHLKKLVWIPYGLFIVNLLALLLVLLRILKLIDDGKKENKESIKEIKREISGFSNLQDSSVRNGEQRFSSDDSRITTQRSGTSQSTINHSNTSHDLVHRISPHDTELVPQDYNTGINCSVNTFSDTELVKSYNSDRNSLAQKGTKVAIGKNSYYQDRSGADKAAVLNEKNKGDFFVLRDGNFEYLFPGEKLNVNQHNLSSVEKLFICHGYESSNHKKIQLIKAAKVTYKDTEWILREQGELNFL
jgi:hypothetical protein